MFGKKRLKEKIERLEAMVELDNTLFTNLRFEVSVLDPSAIQEYSYNYTSRAFLDFWVAGNGRKRQETAEREKIVKIVQEELAKKATPA